MKTFRKLYIPWLTYEATLAILWHGRECRTLFEYGSGFGTLFWRKFFETTSVDDKKAWESYYDVLAEDKKSYVEALDREQDIVIVDGSHRMECAKRATEFAKCMVVVDNTDRNYPWLNDVFSPSKWQRVDYPGVVRLVADTPGRTANDITTIWYAR